MCGERRRGLGKAVRGRKVLILDSSAFILGFTEFTEGRCLTSRLVLDEVCGGAITSLRIKNAIDQGLVILRSPSRKSLEAVSQAAAESGDIQKLSEADKEVLAIALDEKAGNSEPTIISDDYSLQNVASQLGIETTGIAHRGIRRKLSWRWYCPGCFRVYPKDVNLKACTACGTPLRRKPMK